MSRPTWPIRIIPPGTGGMRITPVPMPSEGVILVHIVPPDVQHGTPSYIVPSGGMKVYVENPEALAESYRLWPRDTTSYKKSPSGWWWFAPLIALWPLLVLIAPVPRRTKPYIIGVSLASYGWVFSLNFSGGGETWPLSLRILLLVIGGTLAIAYFTLSYAALLKGNDD